MKDNLSTAKEKVLEDKLSLMEICMKDNLSTAKEKILEDKSSLMEKFMKECGS
jgi:hypothetical protein